MAKITGTPSRDTIASAECDDLLPGGGGGDSLEGSADSDRLVGDKVTATRPRESGVAQAISAAASPTAFGTPMI